MTTRRYDYLLGDSKSEAARLRRQASLWDPTAAALFDRLRIRRGWRVLEIGPGQGSLHLELRRRVRGPVDAVERSTAFCQRLERITRRDGFGAGTIWNSDLLETDLPSSAYDLIFARWVFLFLPDPLAHVMKLAKALKPGGLLAIEDYYRRTFTLVPLPRDWENFIQADLAFFASQGGDANIGARLPELFDRAGLTTVEVTPTIKSGGPRSAVWRWLSAYFLGVLDRLAGLPPFDAAQARRLRKQWLAAAERPESLMVAPMVIDVVGRKKS